jgi:hypothetical protein
MGGIQFFPFDNIWPNFDLKKYDFRLDKGFFMKKMAQILQVFKNFFFKPLKFMISSKKWPRL